MRSQHLGHKFKAREHLFSTYCVPNTMLRCVTALFHVVLGTAVRGGQLVHITASKAQLPRLNEIVYARQTDFKDHVLHQPVLATVVSFSKCTCFFQLYSEITGK